MLQAVNVNETRRKRKRSPETVKKTTKRKIVPTKVVGPAPGPEIHVKFWKTMCIVKISEENEDEYEFLFCGGNV